MPPSFGFPKRDPILENKPYHTAAARDESMDPTTLELSIPEPSAELPKAPATLHPPTPLNSKPYCKDHGTWLFTAL